MRGAKLLLQGLAVGLLSIGAARDTAACGNEIELRLMPAGLVAEGEKLIADGKARGAMDYVREAMNNRQPSFGSSLLEDRALIVAARAVLRSDGELGMFQADAAGAKQAPAAGEGGPTQRVANLEAALDIFKQAAAKKADDPGAQTDLGEALARMPGREAEAKKVLEALEDKGVMASAWGYAALAQLRARSDKARPAWLNAAVVASEQAPRTVALERCSKMATRKDICSGERPSDALAKVPLPRPQGRGMRGPGHGMDSRE